MTADFQAMLANVSNCAGKHVMLSGCGGGYDVFGAVLYYAQLAGVASKITLLNLSFSDKTMLRHEKLATEVTPDLFKVAAGVKMGKDEYFPEGALANALQTPVYAMLKNTTIQGFQDAYKAVFATEGTPDVLYLVDGGCDVLLTGDEKGLGTPVEDMMHLRAVRDLPIASRFILAIGANVDQAHGVVQSDLDQRLADLKNSGGMVFAYLVKDEAEFPAARVYCDVVKGGGPINTIVQSLACAAIEGNRGDFTPKHLVPRIGKSTVPLTDQTATLFCFHLDSIAAEVKYLNDLKLTQTLNSVSHSISVYRGSRR